MSFAANTQRSSKHGNAKRFFDTLPLTKRFEALLRAYNDPRAIITRLAKRLKRDPLSLSDKLLSEKTHDSVGVRASFDEAGLLLEEALRRDSS